MNNDKSTTDQPDQKCTCWHDKDRAITEKFGLRLSRSCQMFGVTDDLGLRLKYGIPLERVDGKKLKKNDARIITFPHCPFCGKKYPVAKEEGAS